MPKRCGWVKMTNPLYVAYHDEEWGRPLHDDQALFELLCMETYQAGLSWETVLNKRQAFRESFHGYHLQRVAEMTDSELETLLDNPAIIRNRAKIFATRAKFVVSFLGLVDRDLAVATRWVDDNAGILI